MSLFIMIIAVKYFKEQINVWQIYIMSHGLFHAISIQFWYGFLVLFHQFNEIRI
jgi:hypothetical protein